MGDNAREITYNADRLVSYMQDADVDAVVATSAENVRYLTGIDSVALEMFPHTGYCFAVVARSAPASPFFVSSRCEADQFLDAAWPLAGAAAYGPFTRVVADGVGLTAEEAALKAVTVDDMSAASPLDALKAALKVLHVDDSRVGIDEAGVAHHFVTAFADDRARGSVIEAGAIFRAARKVKTPAEQASIAATAAVAEQGIAAAIGVAKVGVTEADLVREFERTAVGLGARPKFTLIKIGHAAVRGQTRPSAVPLVSGDAIWFDVGGIVNGYWYDIARVFSVGEPSPKLVSYYDAMLAGEQRAIDVAAAGMRGRDLFALTVEAVRDGGVGHYQRHHVGHGIGVEVYDDVLITPTNDDVLEEGTVVNIETPYYEFGFGAVHVEDPFVVDAAGNRLLTTMPRELGIVQR